MHSRDSSFMYFRKLNTLFNQQIKKLLLCPTVLPIPKGNCSSDFSYTDSFFVCLNFMYMESHGIYFFWVFHLMLCMRFIRAVGPAVVHSFCYIVLQHMK